MKKRFLNVVSLVLVLAMFVPVFSFGEGMKDLEISPYKEEIQKLIEDGVLSGYTDGTFRPEGSITRGEFTKMIANALKLKADKDSAKNFKDVKGKWYEGYVGAVYKAGLMEGTGKTTFSPEENVTREQMAVILIRGLDMEKTANEIKIDLEFVDSENISSWAKNSVVLACKIGIIEGIKNEDGTISFNPEKDADRQIVAKIAYELVYNHETYIKNVDELSSSKEAEKKDENKNETKETEKKDKNGQTQTNEKPDKASVVSKYTSKLSSLQSKYEGKLSSLVSKAKSEYEANKDNPDFSVTELYNKYESLGRSLESQADSEVESVLSQLEGELSSNGYDTSVVNDLRSQYEQAKTSAEDSLQP